MRILPFLLPFVMVGCGSDGDNFRAQSQPVDQAPPPVDLKPFIPVQPGNGGDWTGRLTGLPFVLNDVIWDGDNFIVVGDSGVILTSDNGIDWAQRASGTGADLDTITSDGSDIVVVGDDATVLLSTNHGESWSVKYAEDGVSLRAVVVNAWQIVAGGRYKHTEGAFMMRSEDRGASWTRVQSFPRSGHFVTELVYAGGLFVAATDIPRSTGGTRVWVSIDGNVWQDIVLWADTTAGLYTILNDGNRFIVAGDYGSVYTSTDGATWTRSATPLDQITYRSAARSGSELKLAGGITWWYWWLGAPAFGELDVGLSSGDGGLTWDAFNIDGYFESHGMAWGNGRFVSVGESTTISGEGAIYTAD